MNPIIEGTARALRDMQESLRQDIAAEARDRLSANKQIRAQLDRAIKGLDAALGAVAGDLTQKQLDLAESVESIGARVTEQLAKIDEVEIAARSGNEAAAVGLSELAGSVEVLTQSLDVLATSTDEHLKAHFDALEGAVEQRLRDAVSDVEQRLCAIDGELQALEAGTLSKVVDIVRGAVVAQAKAMAEDLRGEMGPEGRMRRAAAWVPGRCAEGEICTHLGGAWQAKRETDDEPGRSPDWIALTIGIDKIFSEQEGKRLRLVIRDSFGNDREQRVELPAPNFTGKWQNGAEYEQFDAALWDGIQWIRSAPGPFGEPGKDPGWTPFAMRGARGPRGERGVAGPPGQPPLLEKILDGWREYLAQGEGLPLRAYRGLWEYGKSYEPGDLVQFQSCLYLSLRQHAAEMPPATIGQQEWVLVLNAAGGGGSGGGNGGSGNTALPFFLAGGQAANIATIDNSALPFYLTSGASSNINLVAA